MDGQGGEQPQEQRPRDEQKAVDGAEHGAKVRPQRGEKGHEDDQLDGQEPNVGALQPAAV